MKKRFQIPNPESNRSHKCDNEVNSVPTIKFPEKIRLRLMERFKQCKINPYNDPDGAQLEVVQIFYEEIPYWVEKELDRFASNEYPFILLDNCCLREDDLRATPQDDSIEGREFYCERYILGITGLINARCSININELNNLPFHYVIPKASSKYAFEQSSRGSRSFFSWHSENIHLQHQTNLLLLGCLKNTGAITRFMLVKDLIRQLPKSTIENLMQPTFILKTGASYSVKMELHGAPIITKTKEGDNFQIRINAGEGRVEATTEKGKKALMQLLDILKSQESGIGVELLPNQLVLVNNLTCLHSRNSFDPGINPDDFRWLIRMYANYIINTK